MIELLFVACVATEPEQCRERSLVFTDVTPAQCLRGAQPQLAKWSNAHPGFTIKSWRCEAVTVAQKEI